MKVQSFLISTLAVGFINQVKGAQTAAQDISAIQKIAESFFGAANAIAALVTSAKGAGGAAANPPSSGSNSDAPESGNVTSPANESPAPVEENGTVPLDSASGGLAGNSLANMIAAIQGLGASGGLETDNSTSKSGTQGNDNISEQKTEAKKNKLQAKGGKKQGKKKRGKDGNGGKSD